MEVKNCNNLVLTSRILWKEHNLLVMITDLVDFEQAMHIDTTQIWLFSRNIGLKSSGNH